MAVLATERRLVSEEVLATETMLVIGGVLATEIFELSPPRLRSPVTRLDEWKM